MNSISKKTLAIALLTLFVITPLSAKNKKKLTENPIAKRIQHNLTKSKIAQKKTKQLKITNKKISEIEKVIKIKKKKKKKKKRFFFF